MGTALPIDDADVPPASGNRLRNQAFDLYAQELDREHPEHLRSLGMTAEEYAEALAAPAQTIEEAVEAGWMSAEEARFIQGQATREDLARLGYSHEEVRVILEEQQARACASSA